MRYTERPLEDLTGVPGSTIMFIFRNRPNRSRMLSHAALRIAPGAVRFAIRDRRGTCYREKCMNMPAVTAVIATYPAGEYLRHAIGSGAGQDRVDLEILVSDNADDPGMRRLASRSMTHGSATV